MNNVDSIQTLDKYKRTKIIASLDLSNIDYEHIVRMIESGVDGIRLNFSQGNHNEYLTAIKHIRKASRSLVKPVSIIQDLKGPKVCLGSFDGVIPVEKGQTIRLRYGADYIREGIVPINYDLSKKAKRGEKLYIYDGQIKSTITSVKDKTLSITIENNGILLPHKGINLPETNFDGDIITAKDKKDIVFGLENDIDYVAFGFIQAHTDVLRMKRHLKNLGSTAKIISKIETKFSLDDIEKIVECSDAVMIARDDLAIETEPETVPIAGRIIVGLGHKYSKPTIIVTHMMVNIGENPEPTKVEVGDVATAVIIGADAVMLSDESTSGKYPMQAIEFMNKVITYTEQNSPLTAVYEHEYADSKTKAGAISNSILSLANSIGANAIITETKSGSTAFNISGHRPKQIIIGVTASEKVYRQMAILYGCIGYIRQDEQHQGFNMASALLKKKLFNSGDIVVITSGIHPGVVGTTDTIKVRVLE